MGYPISPKIQNATFHVFSSTACNLKLFKKDVVCSLLELVVERAQKKYKFDIYQYVIMPDHIHFIIRTYDDGDSLASIMQYIKGQFGRLYNMETKKHGVVWKSRYKWIMVQGDEKEINKKHIDRLRTQNFNVQYNQKKNTVFDSAKRRSKISDIKENYGPLGLSESEHYLLMLIWYCAYNPVKKRLCEDITEYNWSGINYYLNEEYKPNNRIKITKAPIYFKIGKSSKNRIEMLKKYEEIYFNKYKYNRNSNN